MKEKRIVYRKSNNSPILSYVGFDDIPAGKGTLIKRAAKHAPPEAASFFATGYGSNQYFIDAERVKYYELTEAERRRADDQALFDSAAKLPIFRTRHGEIAVVIRNARGKYCNGVVIETK